MLSVGRRKMMRSCDFHGSTDSQFTDNEEEDITFLEACQDCDEDALYDLIQDGVTYDTVNERDKSGRTGLSHACANGFMPILELLAQVEEVDANLPDKDGNTPLIFSAQAGHADVVNFLLHNFRHIRVDQANLYGFTALMKAAVQGRTRCAKLLLFAGANPNRRDHGRGLCAEDWAKFCGRYTCSEAIAKYVHSKKYMLKKTFMMSREKWSSEPDLFSRKNKKEAEKPKGNWISRHLSFKRKKPGQRQEAPSISELKASVRSSSTPLLYTTECSPPDSPATFRRPSCIDGVVPVDIIPKLKSSSGGQTTSSGKWRGLRAGLEEEPAIVSPEPPQILETDFDVDKTKADDAKKPRDQDQSHTNIPESDIGKCPRADNG